MSDNEIQDAHVTTSEEQQQQTPLEQQQQQTPLEQQQQQTPLEQQQQQTPLEQQQQQTQIEQQQQQTPSNKLKKKMDTGFAACGVFQYQGDVKTIGARWEKWVAKFDLYLRSEKIEDGAQIEAKFLLYMGDQARDVYNAHRKDGDDYASIKKTLTEVFTPKRSVYAEICEFRNAKRFVGESVNEYAMRLRDLATYCAFGSALETEIERQFVVGCGMEELQRKCARTDDLNLQKVLEYAIGFERTNASMAKIRGPSEMASSSRGLIAYATESKPEWWKQPRNDAKTYEKCGYCGGKPHSDRSKCPAAGQKCSKCGRANHFARVCRSAATQNEKDRASGPHRGPPQSRTANRGFPSSGNSGGTAQRVRQVATNAGAVENTTTSGGRMIDEADYAEFLRYKASLGFGLNSVREVATQSVNSIHPADEIKVALNTQGSTVDFMVDTGAKANIIDEPTYRSLVDKPELKECETKFYGYTSDTPIQILGQFTSTICYESRGIEANIVVVKGQHECLLGCKTVLDLGIITLNRINAVQKDVNSELTPAELATKFPKLFSGELGCARNFEVKLDVDPDVKPVRQPQRPVPFHLRDQVADEIRKQVKMGILERLDANSGPTPWVANLVIVPKERSVPSAKCASSRPISEARTKEESQAVDIRITCDSRALNKAIRRTRFPGKTTEDMAYTANEATVFSKLDLTKAFHQIPLAEESRNYTTITTHIGLFRYKRLHMGISCASEVFSEALRVMLEGLPGQMNMMDDILVFGKTKSEHHTNLMAVLKRLEDNGLTLNSNKCEFYRHDLTFFGFKFSASGISPTEDRCRAIRKAKEPTNAKDLKSFLCSVQYSARFIPGLCTMAEPLWQLTRAGTEWKWSKLEQDAFDAVKLAICEKGTAFFNKTWRTELVVDASPVGLSAVLAQTNPSNESERAIVCCASRLLTDVETRYSQCEKEALAAVWGCERLWIYLFGQPFTLVTDNRAVQLLLNNASSKPPARIERLALRLSQFDFTVVHRPGISNVADYFSRHPVDSPPRDETASNVEHYVNAVACAVKPDALTVQEVIDYTAKDTELCELIRLIRGGVSRNKCPSQLSAYKTLFDELNVTKSGILLRGQRILIPAELRRRVLELAHAGHQGIVKTKALVRSRVWFPGIDQEVERLVKNCQQCQAVSDRPSYEPLRPSDMPEGPWRVVAGDFFGPMSDGHYWFVNHDEYSRWASVDRIKSCSFECVAPVLKNLFSTIGTPEVYKSDNGSPFQSYQFANLAKEWGFLHRKITPYWPRANAGAESFMKKLGKVLKTAATTGESKEQALQSFLRAYRATPHSSTGVAPSMLLMGFSRTSGIPQLDPFPKDSKFLSKLHETAQANDKKAKERMKQDYDARMRAREGTIGVGSLVLLKREQTTKSVSPWDPDPFRVTYTNKSLITASREYPKRETVVRNSSFFKPYRYDDVDEEAPVRTYDCKVDSERMSVTEVEEPSASADEGETHNQGGEADLPEDDGRWVESASIGKSNGEKPKRGRGRPSKKEAASRASGKPNDKPVVKPTRISRRIANLPPI